VQGISMLSVAGGLPYRWAHDIRHRECPYLDHEKLRWYRDVTATYRLTADFFLPASLRFLGRLTVEGLENVPLAGPVILAANHRDNLDGPLLLHVVPRMVHVAAREDGFGTGLLCALWRRLGAFPADAWGMRHALSLLAEGQIVALFAQGMISRQLESTSGAVGLLALRSGVAVIPVAISGTEAIHATGLFKQCVDIRVRFGTPLTFPRGVPSAPRSRAVVDDVLLHVGALLAESRPLVHDCLAASSLALPR
jgi:1-acyl-sn-glycerol-3-phosphate acyltransferase